MQSGRAKDQQHYGTLETRQKTARDWAADSILVIGEVSEWGRNGGTLPQGNGVHCAEFHEITAEMLDDLQPMAVFSPLLCSRFDCLDLAALLQMLGFKGRYRAVGGHFPNPGLIRSEIGASCPGIDFDIVDLNGAGTQMLN